MKKSRIWSLYTTGGQALAFAILLPLALLCAWCTVCVLPVGMWQEYCVFARDNLKVQGIAVLGALAAGILLTPALRKSGERLEGNDRLYHCLRRVLFCLCMGLCVLVNVCLQVQAVGDDGAVARAVGQVAAGQYDTFLKGGYVQMCPNQLGLVMTEYLLSFVLGLDNRMACELMNCVFTAVTWLMLADIAGEMGMKRLGRLAVQALGVIYLPMIGLSTFVYGNVPALTLTACAFRLELKYFSTGKKRWMVLSALAICFGCILKSFCLIASVAMVIHALAEIIRQRKAQRLLALGLLILALVGQYALPRAVLKGVTGIDMEAGPSILGHVAMGMYDAQDRGPGWYNDYNVILWGTSDMDPKEHASQAMGMIRDALAGFRAEPKRAAVFFLQKEASLWCEPMFEGIQVIQMRTTAQELAPWARECISVDGMIRLMKPMNILQLLTYLGLLMWLLTPHAGEDGQGVLLLVAFIGFFLFLTASEAKGLYSGQIWPMVFPVACRGWCLGCGVIRDALDARRFSVKALWQPGMRFRLAAAAVCTAAVLVLFAVLYRCGALTDMMTHMPF